MAILPLKEGEGMVAGYNLKEMDWKKVPFLRRTLGCGFPGFSIAYR